MAQFPGINTIESGLSSEYHRSIVQATTVSVYQVKCFFNTMSVSLFGEKIGRRETMVLGIIIMVTGSLIETCTICSLFMYV